MGLMDAVRAGDVDGVVRELAELTPAQRRAELPALKGRRKEIRADWWQRSEGELTALVIAGTGCNTAALAAATWMSSRSVGGSRAWSHPGLLTVIESQPPEWRTALVARLAERATSAWWSGEYELLEYLVRAHGCPVPTSDGFVAGWVRARLWPERRRQVLALPPLGAPAAGTAPGFSFRELAVPGDGGPVGDTLWERLAHDPFVPVLAPRLFDVPDIGSDLAGGPTPRGGDNGWPSCLIRLAEQGVLDRAELIDACLARLLRGGRQGDQRAFLKILQAFAPTMDENAVQVRNYVALLGSESTIAVHAQQVLTALDEAGLLTDELLAEASATVLFRPEKKLVRAQLAWLDRAARRDPVRAGAVVLAAADAFGHPDAELQYRALKLTERHLKAAGDAVLPDLRLAAESLNPAHAALASAVLGGELPPRAAEDYVELLPPVPVRRPMPEPLGSPAEVAEEVGAILAGDTDVVAFERALDGLVRHSYLDRAALVEALEPVLRVNPWAGQAPWWDCTEREIAYVAAVVSGQVPAHRAMRVLRQLGPLSRENHSRFGRVLAGRLEEAAWHCMSRPRPFLLATPTSSGGGLAAEVLVQRLAAYESLGAKAGDADLSQALLRVAPTGDVDVLDAAERLTSRAGQRTARWLKSGGLPRQTSVRTTYEPLTHPGPNRWSAPRAVGLARTLVEQPGTVLDEPLAADAMRLLRPVTGSRGRSTELWSSRYWIAALPHHREELAARMLGHFASAADMEIKDAALLLPHLAEADGPAGTAVHLAVGYGLGARFPGDRAAAVDALLVLAARGDLDGGRLGRELAVLVRAGSVKPNRLSESLRAAADTGAYGTVWSVLATALPGLLVGTPVRGTAELLALATDCARRSGARAPEAPADAAVSDVSVLDVSVLEAVGEVAGRGGSSRLVKEARALRELLGGRPDA
jgi:hypothetical protein